MGLIQLDEGYDDEGNGYSEEEEEEEDDDESQSTDADAEAEVEVFLGPGGGHVEVVTEEESSETDTSVSNSTSTTSSGEVGGFTSYYSFGPDPESSVEESEDSDGGLLTGVIGPVRVVELVQDSEGDIGSDGREKRGRESNKVHGGNGRRRKAEGGEHDDDEADDDDEEERPAQVLTLSKTFTHNS